METSCRNPAGRKPVRKSLTVIRNPVLRGDGLSEKTRLVPFHRPSKKTDDSKDDPNRGPGTFDLLGFTHYWGKTRRGGWAVKFKTMSKRLSRAVRSIAQWRRTHRHLPVREQHRETESEGTRALRVLRDHVQRSSVGQLPGCRPTSMVKVAGSPQQPTRNGLGKIRETAEALPAPAAANRLSPRSSPLLIPCTANSDTFFPR